MANTTPSVTITNLESAFAGGIDSADDIAKIFEETADQEILHAFGHLDLLHPKSVDRQLLR